MGGREARDYWEDWGLVLLWVSLLGGPLAWALHHQLGYASVKPACSGDRAFIPTMIATVMLIATLCAAWLGWSCYQKVHDVANEQGGTLVDRSYFLAIIAVGLNLLLAMLIVIQGFNTFVLSPCE